jgi:PAS domain S-box-containing protein
MGSEQPETVGVLAVTSDDDYAATVETELPGHGAFRVETATSESEAVERLAADRDIECIISDHDPPAIDGVALLETVRVQAPDLPFVLFTSEGDESVASRAISAGVTDYLVREHHGDQWERLAALVRDAVDYYRAHGDLVDTEARTKALLDAANDTIAVVRDGEFTFVNEAGVDLFGLTDREQLSGVPVGETLVSAPGERPIADLVAPGSSGESVTGVAARVEGSEGRVAEVELGATGIEWLNAPAVVLVIRDVSERRDSERRLRRFRRAVEAAGHAIYITDTDGTIRYVNPAFEEMTGYDGEAALGRTPRLLSSGEHDEAYYADLWDTITAGEVWEEPVVNRRRSGERYYADQTIAPITGPDGDPEAFVAIQTDRTEQRRRQTRLREYERAIEGANDLIAAIDTEYTYLFANRQYRDYHEVEDRTLTGTTIEETLDDEMWAEIRQHVDRALAGERVRYQMTRARSARPDRTFDVRYYPLEDDSSGEVRGVVATMRDVTQRQERERQLDVLSRVLRHNLHNDMNVILGNAATLAENTSGTDRERAEVIAETGRDLLDLTDKQKRITELLSEPRIVQSVELTDLLGQTVDQLRDSHPRATIALSLPERVEVRAISEITVAVEQLVENAVEHNDSTPPVVEVDVRTGRETVTVEVADNGPGIPEQERTILTDNDAIEPLYHGSGMGLWLVNWIVTHSGGTLDFEENSPRGSVVSLTLPRTERRTSKPAPAPEA